MKQIFFSVLIILVTNSVSHSTELNESQEQTMNLDLVNTLIEKLNKPNHVNDKTIDEATTLISSLIQSNQVNEVEQLINKLRSLSNLTIIQKAKVLTKQFELERLEEANIDQNKIESQFDSLITELNSLPSSNEKNLALYNLYNQFAISYYHKAEFQLATTHWFNAKKYIDKNNPEELSTLLNYLGTSLARSSRLEEAGQHFLQSIDVLKKNNIEVNPDSYLNLGVFYFSLYDYKKSAEYSKKYVDLTTEDTSRKAKALSNLAGAHIMLKNHDLGIKYLKQSISINTKLDKSTTSARINLADLYNREKQYEKALGELSRAENEIDIWGTAHNLGSIYIAKGVSYTGLNNHEDALKYNQLAYQFFKEQDNNEKLLDLFPSYIDSLIKLDQYKKAYEILLEFKTINDDFSKSQSSKELNELLTSYEVEKKERALIESELELEKQQANLSKLEAEKKIAERNKILMYLVSASLMAVLLLVIRSLRFRGKTNQLLLQNTNRIEEQRNQLIELNKELKFQVENDSLTGLRNRSFITQLIVSESKNEEHQNKKWSLMMIDIDDFKDINDHYGHQEGDQVLINFANCLKSVSNTNDIVARWGGEEFLWLSSIANKQDCFDRCNQLQNQLKNDPLLNNKKYKIRCSVGFSRFPIKSLCFEDWESALFLADQSLYVAKNSGKNQWYGYEVNDSSLKYDDMKNIDELVKQNKIISHSKHS